MYTHIIIKYEIDKKNIYRYRCKEKREIFVVFFFTTEKLNKRGILKHCTHIYPYIYIYIHTQLYRTRLAATATLHPLTHLYIEIYIDIKKKNAYTDI